MARVKHTGRTTQEAAATNSRNFRTFLLMAQFEAQEIGSRIQQARNEKGLTQEELAEMASFSKRSLQDYEGGVTIPYRQLAELGRLLKKPTEWFLYGDEEAVDGDELRTIIKEEVAAALADVREALARVEERLADLEPQAAAPGESSAR